MEVSNTDMLDLIADIENIETFKVILLIEESECLSEQVYCFQTLEELQKITLLEYGKNLERIVVNIGRINWLEILWYFQLKKTKKEHR